jgi:hypothetical protein
MGFDANISIHDLADTYFVGMRMAAEANISSAMCAVSACMRTMTIRLCSPTAFSSHMSMCEQHHSPCALYGSPILRIA